MTDKSIKQLRKIVKELDLDFVYARASLESIETSLQDDRIYLTEQEILENLREKDRLEDEISELEKDIAMYQEMIDVRILNGEIDEDSGDDADDEEDDEENDIDNCEGPDPSYEDSYRYSGWDEVFTGGDY